MKYLIAVDTTDNSKNAFRIAKKNFFTEKDHVYILTVAESASSYPFEDVLNFGSTDTYDDMNQKLEELYSDLLKRFGRKLTRSSIPHTCLMAKGSIKDVICRQAQDLAVDLVVMGRRGLGAFERTFIGSTSQYCVHNLSCSVIVIPSIAGGKLKTEKSKMEGKECNHPDCGSKCKMEKIEIKSQKKMEGKECDHQECGSVCKMERKMKGKECDHPECGPHECSRAFEGKMGEGRVCNHPECAPKECKMSQKEKMKGKERKEEGKEWEGKEGKEWEGKEKEWEKEGEWAEWKEKEGKEKEGMEWQEKKGKEWEGKEWKEKERRKEWEEWKEKERKKEGKEGKEWEGKEKEWEEWKEKERKNWEKEGKEWKGKEKEWKEKERKEKEGKEWKEKGKECNHPDCGPKCNKMENKACSDPRCNKADCPVHSKKSPPGSLYDKKDPLDLSQEKEKEKWKDSDIGKEGKPTYAGVVASEIKSSSPVEHSKKQGSPSKEEEAKWKSQMGKAEMEKEKPVGKWEGASRESKT